MSKTTIIVLSVIGGVVLLAGVCSYTCVYYFMDSVKNRQVVIEDLSNGEVIFLGDNGIHTAPLFSADGARLYYLTRVNINNNPGPFRLVAYSIAENRIIRSLERDDVTLTSSVTRDGRILCYSRKDDHDDICVITGDGSSMKRLTNEKKKRKNAVFSPDGIWVAFMAEDKTTEENNIYLVPSTGGPEIRLTNTGGMFSQISAMTWAQDSRHIAYVSFIDFIIKNLKGVIVDRISLAGMNNIKAVLADPSDPDRYFIIARESDGGLSFFIFIVSRKAKKYEAWKENRSFWEMDYSISPDGRKIAYSMKR